MQKIPGTTAAYALLATTTLLLGSAVVAIAVAIVSWVR
jgi:hypothetical protein